MHRACGQAHWRDAGTLEADPRRGHWLRVGSKGGKLARVALPPLAWDSLARHLAERDPPVLPVRWPPATPVIGSLEADSHAAISSVGGAPRNCCDVAYPHREAAPLIFRYRSPHP